MVIRLEEDREETWLAQVKENTRSNDKRKEKSDFSPSTKENLKDILPRRARRYAIYFRVESSAEKKRIFDPLQRRILRRKYEMGPLA